MDMDGNLIIVNQNRKMTVSPATVIMGGEVTIEWSMPKDEASNKDWLGNMNYFASLFISIDFDIWTRHVKNKRTSNDNNLLARYFLRKCRLNERTLREESVCGFFTFCTNPQMFLPQNCSKTTNRKFFSQNVKILGFSQTVKLSSTNTFFP